MIYKRVSFALIMMALLIIMPAGIGMTDDATTTTTESAAVSQSKPAADQDTATSDLKKAPKMVINTMKYNFGVVQPETEVKYEFVVENQGSGDLIIDSVTPG